jgi:hypothetical protein
MLQDELSLTCSLSQTFLEQILQARKLAQFRATIKHVWLQQASQRRLPDIVATRRSARRVGIPTFYIPQRRS